MRATFDRAIELLGVDRAKTFRQKLEDLPATGKVSAVEEETLAVLTDAAGAAQATRDDDGSSRPSFIGTPFWTAWSATKAVDPGEADAPIC